ncbi:ribonuclease H-like domain-containing protein [Corynascus similis CBS 632.67]
MVQANIVLSPENSQGISEITADSDTLGQLNSLVASKEALKRAGYIVKKLTDAELEKKKRCSTCNIRIAKTRRSQDYKSRNQQQTPQSIVVQQQFVKLRDSLPSANISLQEFGSAQSNIFRCNFHPGKVTMKTWTCCGKHVSAAPCTSKADHDTQDDDNQIIKRRWQFHDTPTQVRFSHRFAVAIDCEMGTAIDEDRELIRLTLIDYFSGEILIDSLVYPDVPMKHFNTRWSGVTRADIEKAHRNRQCFLGRDSARRAVFEYVGPSTIVVGHGAQNDLSSLRWIHYRVVDSYIIELNKRKMLELKAQQGEESVGDKPKEATPDNDKKFGKRRADGLSLKALAMKRLGRDIQEGKMGHDSVEDALAARDLVHTHVITALSNPNALGDRVDSGKSDEAFL